MKIEDLMRREGSFPDVVYRSVSESHKREPCETNGDSHQLQHGRGMPMRACCGRCVVTSNPDRHFLVVADDDIDVEHPDCQMRLVEWSGVMLESYPDCPVHAEVMNSGFDSLFDDFTKWPPPDGRYPIEAWHEVIHIPMVGTEYDGGLRLATEDTQ